MTQGAFVNGEIIRHILTCGLDGCEREEIARILRAVAAYYQLEDVGHLRPVEREELLRLPRVPALPNGAMDEEEDKLCLLVQDFAQAMFTKLIAKKRKGWSGWNDTSCPVLVEDFWEKMNACAAKWRKDPARVDQLVDVANFCAFIWNLAVKDRGNG